MFNVRGVWSALGVMLTLIALFLVLDRYTGTKTIIEAGSGGLNTIFRTLQGRG